MHHPAGRDPRTHAIIGAAMEVHSLLGRGYLERVYATAMQLELARLGVAHDAEVLMPIRYKGHVVPAAYRADLICFGGILVELKVQSRITRADCAQVINYLKLSDLTLGLLLNFGRPSLEYRRFVNSATGKGSSPPA